MAMELRGSLNLSKYYTAPNKPKYYGKALINGVEYNIKGWEKVREGAGETWVSLLFEDPSGEAEKLAEEFAPTPKKETKFKSNYKDLDDDVPF